MNNTKFEKRFRKTVHQEEEGEFYLSKVVENAHADGTSPQKKLPFFREDIIKPLNISSKMNHIKRKASFDGSFIKAKKKSAESRDISSARGT